MVADLLAADVGCTKTDLALFSREAGPFRPIAHGTLPSRAYRGLPELVNAFLSQRSASVRQACIAVAGSVRKQQSTLTGLPWIVNAEQLRDSLNADRVVLINNLEAIAESIPLLRSNELHQLQPGEADPHGPIAVLAPETGLGEAFLIWEGSRYRVHPSKGGHVDFAPRNLLQDQLLSFARSRYGHVSVERVCSGAGISLIYEFLRDGAGGTEPAWLADQLATAEDRTPIIVDAAKDSTQPVELCRQTLELFIEILVAEAGNFALRLLATGGVYLAGGLPPRLIGFLASAFLRPFSDKGQFRRFASSLPIHVVMRKQTAVLGIAARELLTRNAMPSGNDALAMHDGVEEHQASPAREEASALSP
ncbi:glucokinase [Candidatus Bipolaricaulota bacterium]|nr:glucokinase [Candidatus Bipolaricaulota bacterium]